MAEHTKIEWCDATFNPWIGCTKVSPGCDHCYAECSTPARTLQVNWGPGAPRRRTSASNWALPIRWNAQADAFMAQHGRRQRVFCASLADVFDNAVPVQWRRDLFDLIEATPNLDWLLLTKRIGNARSLYGEAFLDSARAWPENVWIGATITSQAEADRDIPKLLAVPARVRFLSMEPLLGPVDLHLKREQPCTMCVSWNCELHGRPDDAPCLRRPDWVIVGGESGPGARPMHPDWARSLRDQCEAAGVPFLFKQWGEWLPGQNEVYPDGRGRKVAHHQDGRWGRTATKENGRNYVSWDVFGALYRGNLWDLDPIPALHAWAERVGKKAAGRLLDGITHDGYPAA